MQFVISRLKGKYKDINAQSLRNSAVDSKTQMSLGTLSWLVEAVPSSTGW